MAFMTALVQPDAPAATPMGSFSRIAITSPSETLRVVDCADVSRSETGVQRDARVTRTVSRE